jgi:very-short-patch-repair endonuclease
MQNKRNNKGQFKKTAILVDKICQNCGVEFQIKESDLKYGRGKCCSRKCVDENKKQTYRGKNNPMFGKTHSEEERLHKSNILINKWKNDIDFVNRVKKSKDKFFERAAIDGTWDRANEKREKTWLKKIGKKSNFVGKYGERECDKTFMNERGMTSIEYAATFINTERTSIEIFTEFILNENNIENISQYNYKGFSFDFYLPKENILIECDGDYWHGYGKLDEELDDTQKRSRKNDKIKNKLAKSANIKLLRFWEHEIHKEGFDKFLLKKIYGK